MASNDEQRSATTILTTAAQSIAARLIANETTAKFTKAEISTTNLFNQSVTELQVLTSLDNVQQTADINTVTVINSNTVNVNVAIDQTKAPNNYQMNSVGLFAVDGDGKEVLYSVTVLKDPVYIHQDAMGSALGIDLETVVGQASNVEISVNPAGAVTNEILKATLADYVKTDDVKSLIPATVIDGSKPADFKEAVTLEKGAVDGAGNAIATTKNVSDGDAETLKSAKEYADTKVSGKADDSTVVHTADMRKPAGDVAGIDEVSTLQTQVDNSAVGTNLLLDSQTQTRTPSWTTGNNDWTKDQGTYLGSNIKYVTAAWTNARYSYKDLLDRGVINTTDDFTYSIYFRVVGEDPAGMSYALARFYSIATTKNSSTTLQLTSLKEGQWTRIVVPFKFIDAKYDPTNDYHYSIRVEMSAAPKVAGARYEFAAPKLEKGSVATDWCPNPAEVLTKSDDSKVAHLSGANNFDTVPTVNNNPLLLASSLPSDLARTGQDANFTGKLQQNGQDVALANNTIARNPDTGVVSEPVDFTKLTVNGGKSVATSDDLKSLEASAWRQLDNKYIIPPSGYTLAPSTSILYRIDDSAHKLYLSGSIALTLMLNAVSVTIQLGSIIKSILTLSVTYIGYHDVYSSWAVVHPTQSGTNLTFLTEEGGAGITGTSGANGELSYVTYDELV
ncbi:hypothetical protein [Levilactobacillus brevis]|uniref:hypothetical protein n=1 Tax=Levilactobacillus brevis TaxID=1580 RepID=UPI00345E4160